MDWVVSVGLLLVTLGIAKSVHEEWAIRGLTDTSYTSLVLWIAGSVTLAYWGLRESNYVICAVAIPAALLYVYWIGSKAYARIRSLM